MQNSLYFSMRDIFFFVVAAMLFAICEVLSMEFNNFFRPIDILGYDFEFNVSVMFFCFGFFIIDLVTELYNTKVADFFIYSKIIAQGVFIVLSGMAIYLGDIPKGDLTASLTHVPMVFFNGIIASFIGYKLTGKIMQHLKIKLQGRFLFSRYLSSTIPGELIFSLIFTTLNFSRGRSFHQVANIFVDLAIIKFILSFVFSLLIVPINNLTKSFLRRNKTDKNNTFYEKGLLD